MIKYIDIAGNVIGVAGVLVCLVAGVSRLAGAYYILGFPAVTLFTVGTGLMVMACLAKLHHISSAKMT